ncbi:epoxide hydrolase 4-like [Notothenia coriiceps]|uniref:Epoxide hydrolase 4-like n=1 Tax=Notothenia coriiceps TaxID=8208 RepID=A0A6I9Q6F2_9TELE|nr:PREDICTED: epoxide hydrolase 4-like [Notothenia coriiceps]
MARVLQYLLLFLMSLSLRIRVLGYWSLIYGYCALCTIVALLKLCWNIILRPTATFQWGVRETPPACLNDTSLGTHCYVRIKESGLRFHFVAAGERGKPLMLFLHGFPEFWFSWRYQLREFKSEFRVVAVDMRGYGESDLPLSSDSYSFDSLVTDVKDIVEYLGYNRCCLVGHDWGGTIAWLFAIQYPEMVTKLIVLNSPHPSVFTGMIVQKNKSQHSFPYVGTYYAHSQSSFTLISPFPRYNDSEGVLRRFKCRQVDVDIEEEEKSRDNLTSPSCLKLQQLPFNTPPLFCGVMDTLLSC